MKKILSIFLVLGLQFSVCTGGLLSAATVFASEATGYSLQTEANISLESNDSFLCVFATSDSNLQSTEQVGIEQSGQAKAGCHKKDSCIFQNDSSRKDTSIVVDSTIDIHYPEAVNQNILKPQLIAFHTKTRDGPLYEDARMFAHVIVKAE